VNEYFLYIYFNVFTIIFTFIVNICNKVFLFENNMGMYMQNLNQQRKRLYRLVKC